VEEAPDDVPVPVLVPVPLEVVEVAVLAAMLKEPVEEYTSLMLPMLTASKVYPAPSGTAGSVNVI